MRRLIVDPVTLACVVVIVAVMVALAGLWIDAENRARRAPDVGRVRRVESSCTFYADGAVTCPPGVFTTTTGVGR